jgi:hypothetical protein
MEDAIVRSRLSDLGSEKAEIEKWWPIIKAAGVRAD